ncbi:MAG: hypothetical protein ACR2P0_19870 [Acidimicrobiales bacterium]
MKQRSWTDGGAEVPTVAATIFSLGAIPIGGLGLITLLFGAWVPAIVFSVAGSALWFTGRWLMDR